MEFKTELDVYRFIMELETYVFESTPIPFSNKVIVDKDIIYDYLDRLRSKLPKEMKECQKLYQKSLKSQEVEGNEEKEETKEKPEEKQDKEAKQGSQVVAATEESGLSVDVDIEKNRILEEAQRIKEKIMREAEIEKNNILLEAHREQRRIIQEAENSQKIIWRGGIC